MTKTVERPRATPTIEYQMQGDAGPCQIVGCTMRATVRVRWDIDGYGEALSWYCDAHTPPASEVDCG